MPSSNHHSTSQQRYLGNKNLFFFIRLPNPNGVNYNIKYFFVPAGIYKFSPATRLGLARVSKSDDSAGKVNSRQHHTQAFLAHTESACKTICTHPSPPSLWRPHLLPPPPRPQGQAGWHPVGEHLLTLPIPVAEYLRPWLTSVFTAPPFPSGPS